MSLDTGYTVIEGIEWGKSEKENVAAKRKLCFVVDGN